MSNKGNSKFNYLKDEIINLKQEYPELSNSRISLIVKRNHKEDNLNHEYLRQYIGKVLAEGSHKALAKQCEEIGIPVDTVGHYWYKGKHFSIHAKNQGLTYDDFREELIAELKEYSPTFQKINREPVSDGHLLVIDPADIHFGKLCKEMETGDEYNIDIARMRVMRGIEGIIKKTSGFNIEHILLIIGNDMLHTEDGKKTTAGTPQDQDGKWYEAFLKAKQTIIDCIEMLIPIADITMHYNPSNHDFYSGFMMADSIYSWFRNCENMSFDFSPSNRKYFSWGNSLIGTTHGDGAKWNNLPLIMAQESKQKWSDTKYRYWYVHHVHHKQILSSKDLVGCTIESLRSPSGTDSWHHKSGYLGTKGIEAFLHHKEYGQIARISHLF